MIVHLKHHQIDKTKWDNCIDVYPNGMVYAYSWYLDVVCPGWEAFVEDDYSAIMPLPVRKKFFLKYLINPYFVQQLGVFSQNTLSDEKIKAFISEVKSRFSFCDFNFNSSNIISYANLTSNYITYLLPLNKPYEQVAEGFDKYSSKYIKRSKLNAELRLEDSTDTSKFLSFYRKYGKFQAGKRFDDCLAGITNELLAHNKGKLYLVMDQANNVIGAVLWAMDNRRAYHLVACTNKKGKEKRVNFLIVDNFIQNHCNQNLTIDFEGSMIPGVAEFFKSFGAQPSYYPRFRYNHLPFPLNLIKK